MTGEFASQARVGIEAGTIVFLHAILESTVQDLCTVSIMKDPPAWERSISKSTFTWDEIRRISPDALRQQGLEKYLTQHFSKKSVPKRIRILLSICPPPSTTIGNSYKWLPAFRYDPDRVLAFDKLRHRIVHEDPLATIENFRDTIKFINKCVLYLEAIVANRYGIRTVAQMNALALSTLPEGGPPMPCGCQ
jgi:hypothetical protein